ncbi:DUF2663 family protein [Paenibacillus lutrae]|uniref:DUF2663 family protein n=1 Tax=Paenibacillus lutrae TaxID=2078573 RepID=A0A7X3JXG5_9BACL|nr:DUF2663 family protein [Paenibacillus lutrae]
MSKINEQIDQFPVAEDTKFMLKELVSRKRKTDGLKSRRNGLTLLNGTLIIVLMFWLIKAASSASSGNVFSLIGYLGSSSASVIFILLAVSLFAYSGSLSKEYKKQKQKYEDLRAETLLKLTASWKSREDSKLRDEITKLLKDQMDINLRFYS